MKGTTMNGLTDLVTSKTGSGISKRIMSAVLAVGGGILLFLGHPQAIAEVKTQAPSILQNWQTMLGAGSSIVSALLAVWSKVQQK
jgi:hypothetical protein